MATATPLQGERHSAPLVSRSAHSGSADLRVPAFAEANSTGGEIEPETALYDLLVYLRQFARDAGVNYDETDAWAAEFYRASLVAPDGWVAFSP